ncbi:soil-associated protein, TIGR03435 family [bacterium A37T11]|nr:soil-associated protein, TIGR03435 family [bacterium A37T11]
MNYQKILLCTFIVLLTTASLHARKHAISDTLGIGMTIPDMKVYRGKLLILDFWDVHCVSCIAAFPKLQALQDTFKDRIQIVLVTTDSREKVDKLKARSHIVQDVRLPMVVSDTSLFHRFPFASVPAHVWVGPDGIIQYMTNGQNTTPESIGAYLQGKDPHLPVKRELKDYDFDAPLMLEGGGRQLNRLLYYSSLAGRMPTDLQQLGVLSNRNGIKNRVKATNASILQLYQLAYGETATSVYRNNNRVVFRVKAPEILNWPDDPAKQDEWMNNHAYSYELKVEPAFQNCLFPLMKKDLDQLFRLKSWLEKQRVPCWVLKKADSADRFKSSGGEWLYTPNHSLGKGATAEIHNLPMEKLVTLLEDITYHFGADARPILDETGYTGNLDILLNNYPASLESLREDLQQYGLDLLPEERAIDMLILEDAP